MKKTVNLDQEKNKLNRNIFKSKKIIKLIIALFGFATLLSFIVGFVQEHITPLYGDNITLGFGLIIWAITLLTWIPATHANKISVQRIALPILGIAAPCLLPSILTFVMAGVFLISVLIYFLTEDMLD